MGLSKPDPEHATEREICRYLLAQSERKAEAERACDEKVSATRSTFILMAFSIYVAFSLERFFRNIAVPFFYDTEHISENSTHSLSTIR